MSQPELPTLIQEIGKIRRAHNKYIQISLMEFKGNKYINVRKFFINALGKDIPEQSGFTIGKRGISDLIELLQLGQEMLVSSVKEPF